MSQTSALPARNSVAGLRIWRIGERPAHPGNMVADMLILIALAVASTADAGSGAQLEGRVSATIQRGITVRDGIPSTRAAEVAPIRQKPRDCTPSDKPETAPSPDCRLIVYDLP